MEPLSEQLRILFRRLNLLNASCCDECCSEQVSMAQCNILREVRLHPGLSMHCIAEELGMDITTLSRQIKSLEAKDVVFRHALPRDRRVSLLELTPAGIEVLERIDAYLSKRIAGIFDRMSGFEQETVIGSLALLNNAMAVRAEADCCNGMPK